MIPILLVALATFGGVYFLTRKGGDAAGFEPIPIPSTVDKSRPTETELAMLAVGDRVIVFVQRPGHPSLAANVAVDAISEGVMRVRASYINAYAYSKAWTKDEPEPPVGATFEFPAAWILYVYPKGATVTSAPAPV